MDNMDYIVDSYKSYPSSVYDFGLCCKAIELIRETDREIERIRQTTGNGETDMWRITREENNPCYVAVVVEKPQSKLREKAKAFIEWFKRSLKA